jgi:hypothetical protein
MSLRTLDQHLLHRDEALALRDGLRLYHQRLTYFSSHRTLYLAETMSIRPTLRVHDQLVQLLSGTWPRSKQRVLKPRRWRVGFDEVLQLNALIVAGELFAARNSRATPYSTTLPWPTPVPSAQLIPPQQCTVWLRPPSGKSIPFAPDSCSISSEPKPLPRVK